MCQHGGQIDDAGGPVDQRLSASSRSHVDQGLAHDVEPASQRGIVERRSLLARALWMNRPDQCFFRIDESQTCALARAAARAAIDSLDRCMAVLRAEEIEADRAGFRPLSPKPCPIACLASSGIRAFSSVLACSCSAWIARVRAKTPANSAQAFRVHHVDDSDRLESRFWWVDPKRLGGSPLSTQRQNLRSAVTIRCWYSGSGMRSDLNPFAAARDYRQHGRPCRHHPHVVLKLGHVLGRGRLLRERPRQHELCLEHRTRTLDPAINVAPIHCNTGWRTCRWISVTDPPELASYHRRLRSSVTTPSWTMRLPDRSSGSASPRFSRHNRISAASSSPIMTRASEPPMKRRRVRVLSVDCKFIAYPVSRNDIYMYNRHKSDVNCFSIQLMKTVKSGRLPPC